MVNFGTGKFLIDLLKSINEREVSKEEILKKIRVKRNLLKKYVSKTWGMTDNTQEAISILNQLIIMIESDILSEYEIKRLIDKVEEHTCKKIKFLFLIQEVSVWPSIESVYVASNERGSVESQVVYLEFLNSNYKGNGDCLAIYRNEYGIPVISSDIYNLKKESPDVVFIQKPYNTVPYKFWPEQILNCCEKVVYIPYGMELNVGLIKYGFQYPTHYKVWKHIVYSERVKNFAIMYGYRNGSNVAVLGHPKADILKISAKMERKIPRRWVEKIGDKKVVLWTPHHLVGDSDEDIGSWSLVKNNILNYFIENRDIVLIFRPHPLLLNNLVKHGLMSSKEVVGFLSMLKDQENIIYDDEMDYRYSFMASDAIITDPTTFSFEYIYTGKPVFVTLKRPEDIYCKEEYLTAAYYGLSKEKIETFLSDVIVEGKDYKLNDRLKFREKELGYRDGVSVGEMIVDYIIAEYNHEIINEVNEVMLSNEETKAGDNFNSGISECP